MNLRTAKQTFRQAVKARLEEDYVGAAQLALAVCVYTFTSEAQGSGNLLSKAYSLLSGLRFDPIPEAQRGACMQALKEARTRFDRTFRNSFKEPV